MALRARVWGGASESGVTHTNSSAAGLWRLRLTRVVQGHQPDGVGGPAGVRAPGALMWHKWRWRCPTPTTSPIPLRTPSSTPSTTRRSRPGRSRGRPSLYALEAELAAIAAPVLVLAGDEDDGCLETSVWLKRVIPTAGLAVIAKSGHTLNIEEPDLVNTLIADFLTRVAAGAWGPRDPRADPGAITGFS